MSRFKKIDSRWVWIGLAAIMILLRMIFSFSPQLVETIYSRGFFQIIRYLNDFTISLSPIPFLYILITLFLGWQIYRFKKSKRNSSSFKSKILGFLFSVSAFLGALVFFFILLWGFNYGRIPLENQLQIKPNRLSDEELLSEFQRTSAILIKNYWDFENSRIDEHYDLTDLENKIRNEVVKTLQEFGYPTPGKVRARLLKPKGVLLRISTAGVYLPWVGECHIDAGLHPIQIPNVMAHEFAHGYGITDEGSCNFVALHACLNSDNLFFKYSASLSYWKTVASNFKLYFPDYYKQLKAQMPQGILNDIKAINDNLDKYPDIFPSSRNFIYNSFLKSQGISEGIKNYSRVILLEVAFQKK